MTYFQAKNAFFIKRCFQPVCFISHSATCINLGEIMIYVSNVKVVSLSYKKTGDQMLGGISISKAPFLYLYPQYFMTIVWYSKSLSSF